MGKRHYSNVKEAEKAIRTRILFMVNLYKDMLWDETRHRNAGYSYHLIGLRHIAWGLDDDLGDYIDHVRMLAEKTVSIEGDCG